MISYLLFSLPSGAPDLENSRKISASQHDTTSNSKSVNTISSSSSFNISNSPKKDIETASPTTVHSQKARKTTTKLGQQYSPHRHSSPNTKFVGNTSDGIGKNYSERDCSVLTTTTTAVAASNVLQTSTPSSVALAIADASSATPQGELFIPCFFHRCVFRARSSCIWIYIFANSHNFHMFWGRFTTHT